MNWWQAILTIFLGNTIVLIPMILNGHASAKYGIPFPVFARASFGVRGTNIPAMLRAIVACGWFGIQTLDRRRYYLSNDQGMESRGCAEIDTLLYFRKPFPLFAFCVSGRSICLLFTWVLKALENCWCSSHLSTCGGIVALLFWAINASHGFRSLFYNSHRNLLLLHHFLIISSCTNGDGWVLGNPLAQYS